MTEILISSCSIIAQQLIQAHVFRNWQIAKDFTRLLGFTLDATFVFRHGYGGIWWHLGAF